MLRVSSRHRRDIVAQQGPRAEHRQGEVGVALLSTERVRAGLWFEQGRLWCGRCRGTPLPLSKRETVVVLVGLEEGDGTGWEWACPAAGPGVEEWGTRVAVQAVDQTGGSRGLGRARLEGSPKSTRLGDSELQVCGSGGDSPVCDQRCSGFCSGSSWGACVTPDSLCGPR